MNKRMVDENGPRTGARLLSFPARTTTKSEGRYAPVLDDPASLAWLRKEQDRFQKKYCPSCIHYDRTRNTFREQGNAYRVDDCRWHGTDLAGTCWEYRQERPDAIGTPTSDVTPIVKPTPLADDAPCGDTFYDFLNLLYRF